MATIINIADAVADELNTASFGVPLTAERVYVPRFDLESVDGLRVQVAPRGLEIGQATRGGAQHDYQADIGIQQKFETGEPIELDPLMDLVEAVADHFRTAKLPVDPPAVCIKVENGPVYAQGHMREARLFTSIVGLTYRVWR